MGINLKADKTISTAVSFLIYNNYNRGNPNASI